MRKEKIKDIGELASTIGTLSLEQREKIMNKVPIKIRCCLYAKHCTNDELRQLINEWELKGDVDKVNMLKNQLKKQRRALKI